MGRFYYENGQTKQALEHFEKAAEGDLWVQTRVGIFYCYTLKDWEHGMAHLNHAAEAGYKPAEEAVRAMNSNINVQIVTGVRDLLYHASNILDERAEDMYSKDQPLMVDRREFSEIQAKKQGLAMDL